MAGVADCLKRRYHELDELVKKISQPDNESRKTGLDDNPDVKLLCDFWNILKEDPTCNISEVVKRQIDLTTSSHTRNRPLRPGSVSCYMADIGKLTTYYNKCEEPLHKNSLIYRADAGSCSKDIKPCNDCKAQSCHSAGTGSLESRLSDCLPLTKVLCSLKDAMSYDKKCSEQITELMDAQERLEQQIQILEDREQQGTKLLKEADCMWSSMEGSFKKKLAAYAQRHKLLTEKLQGVQCSHKKWQKNKKDLETELVTMKNNHQQIVDTTEMKKNDIKFILQEINNIQTRLDNDRKEICATKSSIANKKNASDARIAKIALEMPVLQQKVKDEREFQKKKEAEAKEYIEQAREELQQVCKQLLQKRLENEDLRAEKEALIEEIEFLTQTFDKCKNRCMTKDKEYLEELEKVGQEIAVFMTKCEKCNKKVDTSDKMKCCTDCPKCREAKDCLIINGERCENNPEADCVCMNVKMRLLENVLDNMCTVLEKRAKCPQGKAVADSILKCLRRSRNGKLDGETRRSLQTFIVNGIKNNLNLTIIGGAVKTRCEMDEESHKKLMKCLKLVEPPPENKQDAGTESKKKSCSRWGGPSECNCPDGPLFCICAKKAPRAAANKRDHSCPGRDDHGHPSSSADAPEQDTTMSPGSTDDILCVSDCYEINTSRCYSCQEEPCSDLCGGTSSKAYYKSKGFQPQVLDNSNYAITVPIFPDDNMVLKNTKGCDCKTERRGRPRENIIEEVMGRYPEVQPIQKVSCDVINNEPIRIHKSTLPKNIDFKQLTAERDNDDFITNKSVTPLNLFDVLCLSETKRSIDSDTHSRAKKSTVVQMGVQCNKKWTTKNEDQSEETSCCISDSSSQMLVMEVDKTSIDLIDKQINNNQDTNVGLLKTASGNFRMEFAKCDDKKSLKLKKSASGTLYFEGDRELVHNIISHKDPCKKPGCKKHKPKQTERGMYVSKRDSYINESSELQQTNRNKSNDTCFELQLKNDKETNVLPVVLQMTNSDNLIMIPDVEFVSAYNKIVQRYVRYNKHLYINIIKTDDTQYTIFANGTDNTMPNSNKALVIITPSGQVKLITSSLAENTKFNSIHQQEFNEFLKNLTNKWNNSCNCGINTSIMPFNKTLNQSNTSLQNTHKINSGKYSIDIDERSKDSLISSLQSFLKKKTRLFVPVSKSEQGEILINLKNDDWPVRYGLIKLTPSGEVYIIIDDNNTPDVKEECLDKILRANASRRVGFEDPEMILSPRSNSSDSASCDEFSVPRDLPESANSFFPPFMSNISSTKCEEKLKRSSTTIKQKDSNIKDQITKSIPYITIKPRSDESGFFMSKKHLRFVKDSIFPLNDEFKETSYDENVSVITVESNNSINIPRQSVGTLDAVPKITEDCRAWDSLSYLPPQLPAFLNYEK